MISVPVSVGELIDKLSILHVKQTKISNQEKLSYINKEFELLYNMSSYHLNDIEISKLYHELVEVNSKLWEIEDELRILESPTPTPSLHEERHVKTKKEIICSIIKRKTKEKFLTQTQKNYYDVLISSEVTVCSGPAGVGKSYITMKAAVDLLADPSTPYEKIIIVRPAVEAEEKLGSLPGNVEEKLDPYIFPSYYLLNKIIGKESREKLKELEIIEVFALAFMRGMNIDNSILIFEEGQNATPSQMKLLLTRIGFNSKFFISGDVEQSDRYKNKTHSGLWDAIEKFRDSKVISTFEFKDKNDIVRNPLITKILQKYDNETE